MWVENLLLVYIPTNNSIITNIEEVEIDGNEQKLLVGVSSLLLMMFMTMIYFIMVMKTS
jgi:hypothetical protein